MASRRRESHLGDERDLCGRRRFTGTSSLLGRAGITWAWRDPKQRRGNVGRTRVSVLHGGGGLTVTACSGPSRTASLALGPPGPRPFPEWSP